MPAGRPDEFRRQIGALWKTAMFGVEAVKDVVVRSGQTGRLRLDIALLHNERVQLLQQLGERLLQQVEEHGYDELSAPLRELIEEVRDVEGRIKADSVKATDNAFGAPRGFEPEAAADYGSDEIEAEEARPPERKPARPSRPKKKRNAAGQKKTPGR